MILITPDGIAIPQSKIKSLKCRTCLCIINPDLNTLNFVVDNCKYAKPDSYMNCDLKTRRDFILRAKNNGKLPALLRQPFSNSENFEDVEEVVEFNVPDPIRTFIDKKGRVTVVESE